MDYLDFKLRATKTSLNKFVTRVTISRKHFKTFLLDTPLLRRGVSSNEGLRNLLFMKITPKKIYLENNSITTYKKRRALKVVEV